jgi:hypothetical protein
VRRFLDPVLVILLALLLASLLAFAGALIPYPYGLLVLGVFVIARALYLAGRGGPGR